MNSKKNGVRKLETKFRIFFYKLNSNQTVYENKNKFSCTTVALKS